MNNDFRLSEKQVDKLMAKFKAERDASEGAAAAVWHHATTLLHQAQMSAFQQRTNTGRKQPLDLKGNLTDR